METPVAGQFLLRCAQMYGNELTDGSDCISRRLLCVAPQRTFQGYRADLPENAETNPSRSHREHVCKELQTAGIGLKFVRGLLDR